MSLKVNNVALKSHLQGQFEVPFDKTETMNFINLPVAGGGFRGGPAGRRLVQVPSGQVKGRTLNAGYDSGLGASVAEVPYAGGDLSLMLVLPGKQSEFIAGGLAKIEGKLNASTWNGVLRKMAPYNLDLKLPFYTHRFV